MASLLIWAVGLGDRRPHRRELHPAAAVARSAARMVEIVPTPTFVEALWITGRAFVLGNADRHRASACRSAC